MYTFWNVYLGAYFGIYVGLNWFLIWIVCAVPYISFENLIWYEDWNLLWNGDNVDTLKCLFGRLLWNLCWSTLNFDINSENLILYICWNLLWNGRRCLKIVFECMWYIAICICNTPPRKPNMNRGLPNLQTQTPAKE